MMASEDARYLKSDLEFLGLDVSPNDNSFHVLYKVNYVEAASEGRNRSKVVTSNKSKKTIRLQSLNESTDIHTLAQEVVERCKLIPVSKLPEVEQLLYYLQNRKETADQGSSKLGGRRKGAQGLQDPTPDLLSNLNLGENEVPSLNDIDDYVELLYEDVPAKIKASIMLFCLIRNPDNLEALLEHGTVMGALSRVLREDWRKSVELSTNIMYIFFCFSTYIQFHQVIAHYKIGALCMSIAEHELKRLEMWKQDLEKRKSQISSDENRDQAVKEYDKLERKFNGLAKKQEQLLRVAFYLLLNLAEDTRVELKMKNKGIVRILVTALETRRNLGLNIVIVTFLKKLSIFVENKNDMLKQDVVAKLQPLLPCEDDLQCSLTLRLLLNLSFDPKLRSRMIEVGLLPRIVECMDNPNYEPVAVCLLYHLSLDDKMRTMFSYTQCIPKLVHMVLEAPVGPVNTEVVALCINLATKKRNAQMMVESGGGADLRHLVKRIFKCKDGLLMKVVRNLSQHDAPTKEAFINFIPQFAAAIQKEKEEDFVLECLGTLANLTFGKINFKLLLEKYELMPFVLNVLRPGRAEDDLVLEAINLVGTVALDENCASVLAQSGIVRVLVDLLNAKQEDDEMVLQICYAFYQMLWQEETRNIIVSNTQAPAYLIDLMHDRNPEIRKVCDNTLDIIREYDAEWEKKIQQEKFRWHNSQWLEIVDTQKMVDDDQVYDDGMPPFNQDDYMLYEADFDQMLMDSEGFMNMDEEAGGQLVPSGFVPPYMQELIDENGPEAAYLMQEQHEQLLRMQKQIELQEYYQQQSMGAPDYHHQSMAAGPPPAAYHHGGNHPPDHYAAYPY